MEWFGREIDPEKIYYVLFPDVKRELDPEKKKTYDYIKTLPEQIRYSDKFLITPEDHPNVRPMSGKELIEIAEVVGYIPLFDQFFERTGCITLITVQAFEFWREHSRRMKR